ncbi:MULTISPECIES: hypothetical protein [Streptomyces]|uniref:ABC transporter permease n=1 Tax=Streptomyces dengpaensis TaxID=2049881 RepID=A0ABN5I6J3_9ACTN|nr:MULTISPECIES: hypothetical protein [Streptomyces]AVH58714.1 hypothetical protein C4B68_26420 [Streptomyces dengpaensis]PIB11222.1 hypothetical protein B1C81_05220 [Streptomyces sp. HG99]
MITDLRLALLLTRGSDRREWWRVTLTALGAALATGFALAAVAVASLEGQYHLSVANGLLNQPGERSGIVLTLLLLLVPVLGFLGQCARIGAVHRDRRLAGLRLAGASPAQVRRIAALEAGLACLAGSAVATVFAALLLLREWHEPPAVVWLGFAAIAVTVPLLGALVSAFALRRVVASPLGWVRRVRPSGGRGPVLVFLVATLMILLTGLVMGLVMAPRGFHGPGTAPLLVFTVVIITGAGAVWLTGVTARLTGRLLAARTGNPATLIAAERLRDDPWAAARTHAAVLLVTIVGTAFMGIRQVLLDELNGRAPEARPESMSFYTTGFNLTGAAIVVALTITLSALAVGTAESLATRRRGLAAQTAAGVPGNVLGRALLLETALPLAPAVALAGVGGMVISTGYAFLVEGGGHAVPLVPLLVPLIVYAACLLAAATSLPLLRRSVHPAELRYV